MLEEWGGLAAAAALALGLVWLRARKGRTESARSPASAAERPRAGAAADALLRVVRSELERGHKDAAVAHWLALAAAGLDAHADAALAIRMAALLRDGGRGVEAAAALRTALRCSGEPTGPAVAARVARAAVDVDPGLAVGAATNALASEELEPLDRRDLERLLAKLQGSRGIEPGDGAREPAPGPGGATRADPEPEAPAASTGVRARPEPIELGHHARRLEVALGAPLAIEAAGLRVALASGEHRLVAWREIDAIAVGAVEGLGAKPVLVVDLVAGWRRPPSEPLRIVRLRGDRFDPRKVVDSAGSPVDALRELVDRLLGETGAEPLPDLRAARGRPFAGFRDLTAFEEDVLVAEEGGSAASAGR